jgi:hypothetical protein
LRFKITIHSGHGAPPDAVDLLWERWATRIPEVTATRNGAHIAVTYGTFDGSAPAREARLVAARLELLDHVREICEMHPELRLSWYAVAPLLE